MLKIILDIIKLILGFSTKAISPDEVRIRKSKVKEPKKVRQVQEWIEGQDADGWAARVKTLNLGKFGKRKNLTQRELIRYVRHIIEWGAQIEDIRKTNQEVQLDYNRGGICYPTEIFYL